MIDDCGGSDLSSLLHGVWLFFVFTKFLYVLFKTFVVLSFQLSLLLLLYI